MERKHRIYKDNRDGMTYEIVQLEDGTYASAGTTALGFTVKKKSPKTQDELQLDLDIYATEYGFEDITDNEPIVYENEEYIGEFTF